MSDLPSWTVGLIQKRPETAQIIYAMISHGVRTGKVTSEDVRHIPVTSDKTWGGAAKLLSRCGFKKGNIIVGTRKTSKGHYLCEWILDDYPLAKSILDRMASLLTGLPAKEQDQMELL